VLRLADREACPLDLVLSRPPSGFGNRMAAVLFGLDVARKVYGTLYLEDGFWDPGDDRERYDDYRAAWDFIQIPKASDAPPRPNVVRNESMTGTLVSGAEFPCGTRVHFSTAGSDCWGNRCMKVALGAFNRAAPMLRETVRYDAVPRAPSEPAKGEGPLRVVWHFRYGDIKLKVSDLVIAMVKKRIDAALAPADVRHVIVVADTKRGAFELDHPKMHDMGLEYFNSDDPMQAFGAMLRADVLVSTGSSFAISAAALAPTGSQAHIMFPPKETYKSCQDHVKCAMFGKNTHFKMYFFAANTVPLARDGYALPGYRAKESAMLNAMRDAGGFGADLANLWYEIWV